MRLKSLEEVFKIENYQDPKCNPRFNTFLRDHKNKPNELQLDLTSIQMARTRGIQKIIWLHEKKGYKLETLFKACNIFDRYLRIVGHWTLPFQDVMALACVSLLLAVKLEEDICPSFDNMILLLSASERRGLSKSKLEDLEIDILTRFGYEFNFPGPLESLERFLRLCQLDLNLELKNTCIKILKFQLKFSVFLNCRPSQIAACALIISHNFHQ